MDLPPLPVQDPSQKHSFPRSSPRVLSAAPRDQEVARRLGISPVQRLKSPNRWSSEAGKQIHLPKCVLLGGFSLTCLSWFPVELLECIAIFIDRCPLNRRALGLEETHPSRSTLRIIEV